MKKDNKLKKNCRYKSKYHLEIPFGKKCEICNKIYAFERHHLDYNQPFVVIFVCRNCHMNIHHPKGKHLNKRKVTKQYDKRSNS